MLSVGANLFHGDSWLLVEQKDRANDGVLRYWLVLPLIVGQIFRKFQGHVVESWILSFVLFNIRIQVDWFLIFHKYFAKFVFRHSE